MAALYAIVRPGMQVDGQTFAIVADDDGADYVYTAGQEIPGLDADRVVRVGAARSTPPTNAEQWLAAAAYNIGYFIVSPPQPADSIDAARTTAAQALQSLPDREPTPAEEATAPNQDDGSTPDWHIPTTREELAQYQANAAYVWSQQYPDVAAGDASDPEADLALRHLMTPPVDPTKPHDWLPIATTETDCGFCEQPQDAAIHQL